MSKRFHFFLNDLNSWCGLLLAGLIFLLFFLLHALAFGSLITLLLILSSLSFLFTGGCLSSHLVGIQLIFDHHFLGRLGFLIFWGSIGLGWWFLGFRLFHYFLLNVDGVISKEEVEGLVVVRAEELACGQWVSKNLRNFELIASFTVVGGPNFGDVLDEGLILVILHTE